MKRMIVGLCALIIAICAVSFTAKHKKVPPKVATGNSLTTKGIYKWFCIDLTCSQQSMSTNSVLVASNYTPCGGNEDECEGVECVCAIFAETDGGEPEHPILKTTDPYDPFLQDYAADGDFDSDPEADLNNFRPKED